MNVDNILYLKQNYPDEYAELVEYSSGEEIEEFSVESTNSGHDTLVYKKGNKSLYIHSKVDPYKEAEIILDSINDIDDYEYVLVYGCGLGYLPESLAKKYPDKGIYIYEPTMKSAITYLENSVIPEKNVLGFGFGMDEAKILTFINDIIAKTNRKVLILELPAYKNIYSEQSKLFNDIFLKTVRNKRRAISANKSFQKRWIFNSMANFGSVLSTPNLLAGGTEVFKGKPVIVVAAGPSLEDEIDNLRYIKENKLAYIFAVGSAVNALLTHGIYADAACTYDPTKVNKIVFEKIINENITDIPLIYGSSVGYETVREYPGEMIHVLTTQDTVADYFIRSKDNKRFNVVIDAPSIAIIAVQLLFRLQVGQIILVGQNLALRDNVEYASGIDYYDKAEKKNFHLFPVLSVDGETISTTDYFNGMREGLEKTIEKYSEVYKDTVVYNTTKGGAAIEGAEYIELNDLMDKYMSEEVVLDHWNKLDQTQYNAEYMIQQKEKMDVYRDNLERQIRAVETQLNVVTKLMRFNNYIQIEKEYKKLENLFKEVTRNQYFMRFLKPMNRLYYEFLGNELTYSKTEKNSKKRAEIIIGEITKFIQRFLKDYDAVKYMYNIIGNEIEAYAKRVE